MSPLISCFPCRGPSRAPVGRVISAVLWFRLLLRVLLGPLQVLAGLVDPSDYWPEVLGIPVWMGILATVVRFDLSVGGSIALMWGVAASIVMGLHLLGYRSRDL